MEVHHHTHTADPDSHRSRKKWTHYFWEFLMLFLAVFCGFLAENQREHLVEHNREKQFMRSMLEDLRSDTAEFSRAKRNLLNRIPLLEAAIPLLYLEDLSDSTVKKMYEHVPQTVLSTFSLNFEHRTATQLKNAGNLRLIRNKKVTDSLAAYWRRAESTSDIAIGGYQEIVNEAQNIMHKLFNDNYYEYRLYSLALKKNVTPKLIINDKAALLELANKLLEVLKLFSRLESNFIDHLDQKAINLINLIEEEYHLK